jgi:ligand-binding sensor domain-containing protein/signal transduction histidine kinase
VRRDKRLKYSGIYPYPGIEQIVRRSWVLTLVLAVLTLSTGVAGERLPMRLYSTADGLWSSFINSMIRDSHGFIWLCTRDGLSRFDGYRFINYKISGGPSAQNFTFMYEDRAGKFWIFLYGKGLYRYDASAATAVSLPANGGADDGRIMLSAELVSSNTFGGVFEDPEGHLWAWSKGLFLVEQQSGRFSLREISLNLPPDLQSSLAINSIAASHGSLWLGTTRGLFRRLSDGRTVQYTINQNLGSDYVRSISADQSGNLWVTHPHGLYVFKPAPLSALEPGKPFQFVQLHAHASVGEYPLPSQPDEVVDCTGLGIFAGSAKQITAVYQQSNGQLWLAAHDRLVLFDGRHFRYYTDSRSPFSHLVEDLDGDLWVATLDGIMRFSLRGLVSYDRNDGLKDPEIDSIHEDPEGKLYAVSPGWIISQLREKKFESVHPNIPASSRLWTSPLGFLDHTGQWWFLTGSGLYHFPRVRGMEDLAHVKPTLYTNLDGLPAQWVYCIFEDSRGDLWISVRWTEQGLIGLVRWRRSTGTFHRFTEADGLPPLKSAASFAEDRAGNLWAGFYEEGLVRYSSGRFTSFTSADGVPHGFITTLHVDKKGRLWLTSTSGGLARVDKPDAERPQFLGYTTREGLSSDNARSLTEDLDGRIYIGTVRGVDRLTPETGKFKHYGSADGLAGDFVLTAFRDRKGALWFGTFNGLSRLEPRPEAEPAPPSILIDGLRVAGVKQPLNELGTPAVSGLELAAAQNNLQIDFSSLSMAHAALLRYQYKLQGVDKDWSSPTEQRTVHYANLAPGKYEFLVRALDSSGRSSPQPASVTFRILPPFWRRWWFLILAATLMVCLATLLYRYRVAHLLELERVRTHIATDLHDDIGSSLSQIAVLSEVARRQVDGNVSVSRPLSTIASTSRELVDSMSDIVWAINPNRDHLSDLSQRMRRFASDLLTAQDIEFRFDAQETERPVKLDAHVRRQVFLIFKESLHNVVRHSACRNVTIELRIQKHAMHLALSDDGRGFDPQHESNGHGLMSMRQRASTLGATLEIASRETQGTVISLKVPLARRMALT